MLDEQVATGELVRRVVQLYTRAGWQVTNHREDNLTFSKRHSPNFFLLLLLFPASSISCSAAAMC